jgi:hypothetical protein
MKEILKYIVLILLISISNQKDFKNCYNNSSPNLRNCINEVYPEFPTVACCYQEIKCRDKDKDLNNICNNKTCIISKVNKTFIHNYIKKMKMSDYNIKSVSVQCSSNYLNLFFSLIFLIF